MDLTSSIFGTTIAVIGLVVAVLLTAIFSALLSKKYSKIEDEGYYD